VKVLLVGGGGRESALAWALDGADEVRTLRCAPGNAGIARHAERVPIASDDLRALEEHAAAESYDLVVIGPEAPLVAGLADRLRSRGTPVFGPSADAAAIEGSKAFAKHFMARHGIPTAGFQVHDDLDEATRYLRSEEVSYPVVIKADGLAAGKGVVLVDDAARAVEVADSMLSGRAFGAAGSRIVVEEMLRGTEVSYFALSDGADFVDLATCQDYKRAEDGDRGANTGGMGAYSPSVYLDEATCATIRERVVAPTLRGLAEEGRTFQGVLYVGVMLTGDGPKVLEYNARFGDPETQVLLPRLEGSWLPLLLASATGGLGRIAPRWREDASVCVVMTSAGYPGAFSKGAVIDGLDDAAAIPGALVFHAATALYGTSVRTDGGRVLGVTATGSALSAAREIAYAAVSKIHWAGEHHRSDIAEDAVTRLAAGSRTR
jgi:phosphoribosylamine--glycine ligase